MNSWNYNSVMLHVLYFQLYKLYFMASVTRRIALGICWGLLCRGTVADSRKASSSQSPCPRRCWPRGALAQRTCPCGTWAGRERSWWWSRSRFAMYPGEPSGGSSPQPQTCSHGGICANQWTLNNNLCLSQTNIIFKCFFTDVYL